MGLKTDDSKQSLELIYEFKFCTVSEHDLAHFLEPQSRP